MDGPFAECSVEDKPRSAILKQRGMPYMYGDMFGNHFGEIECYENRVEDMPVYCMSKCGAFQLELCVFISGAATEALGIQSRSSHRSFSVGNLGL